MMTLCSPQAFLARFHNYETKKSFPRNKFKLDRVRYFLRILGNPQDQFFAFHIAGSKGKGSSCAFCAYILRELGYRVGLYSSPHLLNMTERIRILNPLHTKRYPRNMFEGAISPTSFNLLFREIQSAYDRVKARKEIQGLTFFEVFTCACFYYFAKKKVDVAVIETGLGGRLDATNTLGKKICGIVPIGLEHIDQLGPGIDDIAREKAGIINARALSVVSAPQLFSVNRILKKQTVQLGLTMLRLNNDVIFHSIQQKSRGQVFSVRTSRHKFEELRTSLLGEHQAMNAALAIGMVESFHRITSSGSLSKKAIARGIRRTLWPGRFEIIRKRPTIILDCAHSEQSIKVFIKSYHKIFSYQKAWIVLGVSEDKDRQRICQQLEPIAQEVILTQSQHPRRHCFSAEEARALFRKRPVKIIEDAKEAFETAIKQAKAQDIVIVIGSVFLVGEIKAYASR
jgi:dihydrofolate synthase / folylpolyglutamate synthase